MKPSRPPIRALGNAIPGTGNPIIYQGDPRVCRNSSANGLIENKPIIRHLSQNHDTQTRVLVNAPAFTRGSSPQVVHRVPLQEAYKVLNIQNQMSMTHQAPAQQGGQNQAPIPLKTQQLDLSVKQSYIVNQQHQSPRSNFIDNSQYQQQQQIIKQQADQIVQLQQQLSEKVHSYQQLQEKLNVEFKSFQQDFFAQMHQFELNVQTNDYTQQFMNEIDRKVQNLQNNINEQIKELQRQFELKQQQSEHLAKNIQANTNIRLCEDEAYFKGEVEILMKKLEGKMDRAKAEHLINNQIHMLQSQYSTQLQTAQSLLNKINSDKTDELKLVKQQIHSTLQQLNQTVHQKLQAMFDQLNEQTESQTHQKQEKKALTQQFTVLSNKFQQLQTQFLEKQEQWKAKLKKSENEKHELFKRWEQTQNQLEQQQKEIKNLQLIQSPIVHKMSPQMNKHSSFFSNSTAANMSKSKRARITSITQQNLPAKKNRQAHSRGEISLDDFADFNENSLDDSSDCEINQTGGFTKGGGTILVAQELQLSPKQPFQQSQLININKLLNSEEMKEAPYRAKSAPPSSKLKLLEKAIQRRLLVQGQAGKQLLCNYSPGQHLSDAQMGIYLLDENDEPFTINQAELDFLVQQKLIKLIR